ncbi:hypothetical protein Tco_1032829 [Tanacetum coccineum]|uniref:Uncharacterized protein n=1 Tax=Tanacetum coccineum TaxID=301880 RepID=A0ABQ5GCX4_9ASTR
MLIKRVTGISESLRKSFYISGLKTLLQCALLRLAPTTLGEAFSIARIMEARFESIAGKKLNIEEKIDIVLSWPIEEDPPVIKVSLDPNEDIGIIEVSSAIDDIFDIGESNVESIDVRSEFCEFLENKVWKRVAPPAPHTTYIRGYISLHNLTISHLEAGHFTALCLK